MRRSTDLMRWAGCVLAAALVALPVLAAGAKDAKDAKGAKSVGAGPASGGYAAAAKVLDRYVEATGGKAAHEAVTSSVSKVTLTIPAQSITLNMMLYQARPNRLYTRIESEMTGVIESGVSDSVAWEMSAMSGPRLKEGQEKADALRDAAFDALTDWRVYYPKVELAGVDTVDGAVCDKVVLTPATGTPRTMYLERASGLIRRYDLTVESPAGSLTVKSTLGDYRKEGAILVPHRTEIDALGQKRVMTVDSVAVNPDIPSERFAPPAEVKKLLEAKK